MSSFSLRNFMVLEAGSNHKQEHNSTDVNAWISCSKFCLEQDPNNRELLCQLSVLERRSQCIEVENPEDITGESIKHAKEAIALDGISWYAMGRVCLSAYYMTGTLDHNMLLQSTKAYKNSAKDQKMMHCAELWYNCSMAYKFLENYLMALTGLIMDPNLKSLEQTLNLCDVLDYINSLLQKLNDAKQLSSPTSSSLPTIDSLASSLASVELDPSYEIERANVNRLTEGLNEGKAVTAVNNLSKEVEHPEEITGESIKHAKEAVALDVQDGISWHALGNACLPVYFLTGTWHHDMLVQSVKANKNAVKNGKMKRSAEFCYNCSMMYKFLENCWMALTGFESAGLIMDPSLQSLKQSLNLCDVLDNINSLLQHNQSK